MNLLMHGPARMRWVYSAACCVHLYLSQDAANHNTCFVPMLRPLQVVVHPGVSGFPDAQVSILRVMTALAAGDKGSRFILGQFRNNVGQDKLKLYTWSMMFVYVPVAMHSCAC